MPDNIEVAISPVKTKDAAAQGPDQDQLETKMKPKSNKEEEGKQPLQPNGDAEEKAAKDTKDGGHDKQKDNGQDKKTEGGQDKKKAAEANRDLVTLKREIGLFSGVTIILGNIIGSGIFITPTSVFNNAGSFGMSMVIWVASGIFSLIGALCFAELGTTIDSSGAEYTYIKEAFGSISAFVVLWVNLIIIIPTGHMIVALTFAYYLVDPFFPDPECPPPDLFVRIVACLVQGKWEWESCSS